MAKILLQLPKNISLEELPQELSLGKEFHVERTNETYILEEAPAIDMGYFEGGALQEIEECYVLRKNK
ncbi:hypothetical protein NEFER03_1111 [Nematocida sp. LUAm3]|nr:hypothetical protein NEFER03_1111 [Nematocida sp. LUAm3]KAI5176311.1 hypothetical protein NEFER02_2099 [Nematocida sp. LUAm2]KAI5178225.1 hypothetical protein NEFER01_1392 [Nematocida sp. LUAm1]